MPKTRMMEERLRFLNIDRDVVAELRKAKDILEPAMNEMLDRFYAHILGEPELRALFVDPESIDRARAAQQKHWQEALFDGNYGNDYYEKANQIGRAHARVGLTPNWYIGAYSQMLGQFIDLITASYVDRNETPTRIIQAVSKIVFLDMDLVIQCYLDAKDDSMLQILSRATDFKADVWSISDDLNAIAVAIKSTAEALSSAAPEQSGTPPSGNSASAENGAATMARVRELLEQAENLSHKSNELDERLKRMMLNEKLYVEEPEPPPGFIQNLKSLFPRNR